MGFCTTREYEEFLEAAPSFEQMLVRSGISLLKYYLDITQGTGAAGCAERREDPLKQWKISPIDEAAQKHWRDYSRARDSMLLRTHHADAPWMVVRANDKQQARLNVIRDVLRRVPSAKKHRHAAPADPRVVRKFHPTLLSSGWVAP